MGLSAKSARKEGTGVEVPALLPPMLWHLTGDLLETAQDTEKRVPGSTRAVPTSSPHAGERGQRSREGLLFDCFLKGHSGHQSLFPCCPNPLTDACFNQCRFTNTKTLVLGGKDSLEGACVDGCAFVYPHLVLPLPIGSSVPCLTG